VGRYEVRLFSASNRRQFMAYLDEISAGFIPNDNRADLR
jgi:hypothetical protein